MTGYRILLVEDCQFSALTARKLLEHLGHSVLAVAPSGEQALEMAAELLPQIVLMDVNLAGELNGIDAAKLIVENLDIPVILVTGESDEEMLETVPQSLAAGFVKKPIDLEELKVGLAIASYKHDLEKKLKASEKKFRNIFNNSAAGIYVSDASGRYLDCNETFARLLGFDSPEELQNGVKSIAGQVYVDPDRHAKLLAELSANGRLMDFESEIYGRDGDAFWISEHCQAEFDPDGRISRFEGVVIDVTARIEAEQAYRSTLELLQRTINTVPEVIFLLDLECNIILCNDAFREIFGQPGDELVARSCKEFICPSCASAGDCFLPEVKQGPGKRVRRIRLGLAGGQYDMTVAPFCDPKGEVIGAVHTLVEVNNPAAAR